MTLISWVVLTHNRGHIVEKAMAHNFANIRFDPNEIELVWVDNGSTDGVCRKVMAEMDPEVSVLYNENRGVAKGYNAGFGMARGKYIVVTGSDMLMPDNWLETMFDYVTKIPETGVACVYSSHWTEKRERLRFPYGIQEINGLPLVHAMPIERRIFRRELLADFGYFPESLGAYAWDDICWAYHVEKVCLEKGLLNYVIPDLVAEHLGTEGINRHDGKDDAEYHAMKQKEVMDPAKKIEMARLEALGWPKFSPFP